VSTRGHLHLIGCAAPAVLRFEDVVLAAVAAGWQVHPVLTPTAARWLEGDLAAVQRAAGTAVRSEYPMPGAGPRVPPPDAVLVAPATANSVNKCAAGISDTLALGTLNDAIGRRLPVVMVAVTGPDGAHPAYRRSVELLGSAGVEVIAWPSGPSPLEPGEPLPVAAGLAVLAARDRPPSGRSTTAEHPGNTVHERQT
jgi:Flavoprotein